MIKGKFISRNNRELNKGDLVGVHWNSHKNTYSIVKMNTRNSVGLVLGYADNITLENCTVKIDKSKQREVRETGVKDRHAFVVGEIKNFKPTHHKSEIYYNPHKLDSFVDRKQYEDNNGTAWYLKDMKEVSLVSFEINDKKYPKVFYVPTSIPA